MNRLVMHSPEINIYDKFVDDVIFATADHHHVHPSLSVQLPKR